ncbi:ral guanine nucleotide dissociation stimulator-like 2 isoform X1 [Salmo salar]|uniref:Ral guanine nucleotide dissociation stimulator-like 2 isoform X1 n=1 Tax=Salmo salar TaxID=8030 RepID=A0A1S3RWN8_SALSA|nr:ral guanine nucleotide dissociation stimulator-like 2 isoform X1 [Salmo salar]|eukprot:XP_014056214.1 PREDICTED: ral guanine nucleotide dissociation stimulator-like 2 isoform X1 [Salmo salar]
MIPRSMRTGGMDLPGVESRDVPLIGYRPLAPDDVRLSSQSGQVTESAGLDSSEGETSPMKTTWYCPLDLSTVLEEEEDGVIYNVVVKQQHGAPTSATSSSRSQCVKAGTEEKLVQHLLHSFAMGDSSFITIFLSTYRSFTSTKRVLDILIDRLQHPPGESTRSQTRQPFNRAVCMVFSMWLSEYPEDFRSLGEPGLLLRLAPLLPSDPSGTEIRGRLLRLAEELSEQALLPDSSSDRTTASPPADPTKFDPTNILGFPAGLIAEQLTKIETELFVRLVPYHCLGSLWSQRDKKGHEGVCWSVRATVRQFNRLANAVMASCLWPTQLRSQQRACLLEKWISVAEECRARKNFSSLYAIVSALQSNPVHRLRRTWLETDREAVRRYEELSNIFSEKDNYSQSRELLKEEGTSKFANLDGKMTKRRQIGSSAQGTVPYLGIFLTDLTMLDTAVKDRLENGYINFDKRRREFEVLAQIRLLQSSCKNCVFLTDEAFLQWYQSVPSLNEEESYRLSNEIEVPCEPSSGRTLNPTVIITRCPNLNSSRTSLLADSDGLFDFPSPVCHFLSKFTKHMKSPSVSCLDVDSSPPTNDPIPSALTPSTPIKSHRRSVSCGNNPTNNNKGSGPDMRIVRIRMDLQDGNMYRSILVTSNDKTPTVISSALEKHSQDPKQASRYELIQLLPEGKELVIPATGNVFYAMTSSSVDFLLRRQGGNTPFRSQPISTETSATFPRIKAKGRRQLFPK